MSTISRLDARLLRVSLTRPWAADVTSVGVIATRVVRSDGAEGWGFSWTPQIGAEAVHALIAHDIAAAAIGRSAAPGEAWQGLWEHLHEAGGGGVTTIALAGLDLAQLGGVVRVADHDGAAARTADPLHRGHPVEREALAGLPAAPVAQQEDPAAGDREQTAAL